MKITASIVRHSRWIHFPGAVLFVLLQRTPVLNLLLQGEEKVLEAPLGSLLPSLAAAAATLGAVNSMAGATPLTVSSGSSTGFSVASGTAVSVSISLSGANSTFDPPASWTVNGQIPPGVDYSGLTSSGIANVQTLHVGGTPTAAGTYAVTLQVFSDPDAMGAFVSSTYTYTITVTGSSNVAPSISTQPTGQTVTAGASASFTVAASGTPTPTLQWQRMPSGGSFANVTNGGAYAGATSGTLTVSGTTTGMNGDQFRCVATNTAGSATSNAVTLTVNAATAAPAFSQQPAAQSVTAGNGATFTVAVTGSPAPTLRWQRMPSGGAAFADLAEGGTYTGTTGATLSVAGTTLGMSGDQFRCVATNTSGSATSAAAALTVNPVPVVNSISYDSTNFPGHAAPGAVINFTYHVTNTGTNAWGPNHYLLVRDAADNNLFFASLNGVAPGAGTTASLQLTAPATPGPFTFYVQALENNVAYFTARAPLALLVGGSGPDFNADGHPDILWENTSTGDRAIWEMNGTNLLGFAYLALIPTEWRVVGAVDYNGDGQTDILWEDTTTGDRAIWLMNGEAISSFEYLAQIPTEWRLSGAGDFDGDGQTDLLWQDTVTGDCAAWLMNGTTIKSFLYLANVPTEWRIAGVVDFNGDGKPDILWEDTVTGDRAFWLMDGATILSFDYLANVSTDWRIGGIADYNGDGKPDLLWENTVTGDRGIWLMDGTTISSIVYLALIPPEWRIAD